MTTRTWIDACFIRGGTSKGLFFDAASLPTDQAERDTALCVVMGSPDAHGRQLNGMGGGISSLSKVMLVSKSKRAGFDLDYTFGQVEVAKASVDYSGNCGNLSCGVVPFALAAGLLESRDSVQEFTLFNTNTSKTVKTTLTVKDGQAETHGDLVLPGVSGTGSPITLSYPNPAGSRTAGLLPSGNPTDTLSIDDQDYTVSLVDATLPVVIVRASDLGLDGTESPADIDANLPVKDTLEKLRQAGALAMGFEQCPEVVPKIAMIAAPTDSHTLDGSRLAAGDVDVMVRMISMSKAHLAVPGTGAMCLAAAAATEGTLVSAITGVTDKVRLGTPSGAVVAAANNTDDGLESTSLIRTARILMRGQVPLDN